MVAYFCMMKHMIEGKRIILRPITIDDVDLCTKWTQDIDVVKHVIQETKTYEEELEWLKGLEDTPTEHVFVIIVEETDTPIGTCAVHEVSKDELTADQEGMSVGIMIGEKDFWGKGYGSEAIDLVTEYAHTKLGAQRVWLTVDTVHDRAIRAYEKVGFTICKQQKNAERIFSNGEQYVMERTFS